MTLAKKYATFFIPFTPFFQGVGRCETLVLYMITDSSFTDGMIERYPVNA